VEELELIFARAIFSEEAILRAAHRHSGLFGVDIQVAAENIIVRLTPFGGQARCDDLASRFRNDALDEVLRERIRAETSDLHAALVEAAYSNLIPSKEQVE